MQCLMIGGRDACLKALAVGNSIIGRTRKMFKLKKLGDYSAVNIEALGAEHTYGSHSKSLDSREVLLRISVTHPDVRALNLLSTEISPAALAMSPGITGSGGGGRPRYRQNLLYHSSLVDKSAVPVKIHVGNDEPISRIYSHVPKSVHSDRKVDTYIRPQQWNEISKANSQNFVAVPLIKLCYGRSGDKGDVANIGIICRDKKYFPAIYDQLTEQAVKEYMGHLVKGKVVRFILPGIHGFNFVCTRALGGGSICSLNMDRQGKCYAQMLLDFTVNVPKEWINTQSKL